jgi:hypothetical protein
MRKVKDDHFIDPRTNFARSWRDNLPVEPAQEDDPPWLKVIATVCLAAVILTAMFV